MRGFFNHLKIHIFRGLLAIIPIGLSYLVVLRESQVRNLDWSASEAMNSIISGGMVGPVEI